tara:strand:- start:4 stop:261 length:258 start_codon:yes stop_codon:yes gene_type:complete
MPAPVETLIPVPTVLLLLLDGPAVGFSVPPLNTLNEPLAVSVGFALISVGKEITPKKLLVALPIPFAISVFADDPSILGILVKYL